MDELFLKTFRQLADLTASDVDLCDQYFEPITENRHTILEEEGKIPKHFYFLLSGYCRLYYVDETGLEVSSHISSLGEFMTSFLSFINQKVYRELLECLIDCSLLRIKRTDLEKLISMSEAFKAFSLVVFQHAIASSLERADELATTDAETRYRRLMDTRPELVQHVPIQYIASYLGIKAPSLSRIRRKIKF
jgi:CRP-like cAMP-binding protein